MRIDILTREYPPNIYGGAGVHVAELTRALRELPDLTVSVRAFDEPVDEADTTGYPTPENLTSANAALKTLGVDVAMASDVVTEGADLVHSHTWYANMGGHLASLLGGIPHVISAHSLEPMRPWKAEQLGGGYRVSSWAEKTAYEAAAGVIAVSAGMRKDILASYPDIDPDRVHVVHNGIDSELWQRNTSAEARAAVQELGVDPDRPSVVFVGRITRQKGLPYLLRALAELPSEVQVVLLAGAPDTEEIKNEVIALVDQLRDGRGPGAGGVTWIGDMLPRDKVIAVLSHATVFLCPSVYEPLGIVNLEAMACGAAVVATATGGIPEVVVDGETGWLVPIDQVTDGTGTPTDPDTFVADLAAAINEAVSDPERAERMGAAGRARAVEHFSWSSIADRTLEVYRSVVDGWS
ncbi:glycogen synthase [Ornithinimicrobium cryptoxanthini]|uniref:Glycogen synthase n=1 Tax=Ornithinimicrobium cryptoxanthini TaxID=2934161 RepID=A0ABY4YDN9_9MICO|nr:glycogen synthase [Ornithinimicrobium cryptoxanthini]USQ74890.1 glycogen synthase [Ornithinimicrobium cryptoxanthini]